MRKIKKYLLEIWNEIISDPEADLLQEAILADYNNWVKEKPKQKMKKQYRIIESHKYKRYHPFPSYMEIGYIIQYYNTLPSTSNVNFKKSGFWADLNMINYATAEQAMKKLEQLKEVEELEKKGAKVVYTTEF